MSSFDDLVSDVLQTLQGYGLSQPRAAFLTAGITTTSTSVSVSDAANFEQGVAEIGDEIVFIDSVDAASNILTLSPDGRGFYGTTAATHLTDARITMAPTWPRGRVAGAINEAILGTYPTLFGVFSTSFAYNPSINTYSLPAATERVLRVTADTIGPSREQVQLTRYTFNSNTNSDFATGNAITLEKGAFPGKNINVVYAAAPSELTFGDQFTVSGLKETAKYAIKLAACSNLLSYMDAARLPVGTAVADEYDPSQNAIGTAAKISANLYQRYLLELDTERKRLRDSTPVPVTVRTR